METNYGDTYYVQNITLGPVMAPDIKLTLGGLDAIDLLQEKGDLIEKSNDLKRLLKMGLLKRLTKNQFEKWEEHQILRAKAELRKQNEHIRRTTVELDDDVSFDAEQIDVESGVNYRHEPIYSTGQANDQLSYAEVYGILENMAKSRGDDLNPEQFREMVEHNPMLIKQVLSKHRTASDDQIKYNINRKATYVMPDEFGTTSAVQQYMKKDAREVTYVENNPMPEDYSAVKYASQEDLPHLIEETDINLAESIDLSEDD